MGQITNPNSPYYVPPGHKGFWLNKATFIIVKESTDIEALREKIKNRKGPGWELGYVEQYHDNKSSSRHRRTQ
jgi:hypothetical protein